MSVAVESAGSPEFFNEFEAPAEITEQEEQTSRVWGIVSSLGDNLYNVGAGGYTVFTGGATIPEEKKIPEKRPSELISYVNLDRARFNTNGISEEAIKRFIVVFTFAIIKMVYDGQTEHNAAVEKAKTDYKLDQQKNRSRDLMNQSATDFKQISAFFGVAAMVTPIFAPQLLKHACGEKVQSWMRNFSLTASYGEPQSMRKLQNLFEKMLPQIPQYGTQTTQVVQQVNQGMIQAYDVEKNTTMQKTQKAGERSSAASGDQQRMRQMVDSFLQAEKQMSQQIAAPAA